MKMLDFAIVGFQKCGTTSLASQLSQLEQVDFCRNKEPQFFSKSQNIENELNDYFKLYEDTNSKVKGEASTSYTFVDEYPDTAKRLYEHNPNLKMVFLLRDPVARIESHFNHRIRNKTIKNDPLKSIGEHPCFIERSQYFRQISAYLNYFPKEQIYLLSFDDYIKEPKSSFIKVVSFLGLPQDGLKEVDFQASNVSDGALKYKNNPFIKSVFKGIEKLPFSYKLSSVIPIKIRFEMSIKRLLWLALEQDMKLLEKEHGFDCNMWRRKYSFSDNARIK